MTGEPQTTSPTDPPLATTAPLDYAPPRRRMFSGDQLFGWGALVYGAMLLLDASSDLIGLLWAMASLRSLPSSLFASAGSWIAIASMSVQFILGAGVLAMASLFMRKRPNARRHLATLLYVAIGAIVGVSSLSLFRMMYNIGIDALSLLGFGTWVTSAIVTVVTPLLFPALLAMGLTRLERDEAEADDSSAPEGATQVLNEGTP